MRRQCEILPLHLVSTEEKPALLSLEHSCLLYSFLVAYSSQMSSGNKHHGEANTKPRGSSCLCALLWFHDLWSTDVLWLDDGVDTQNSSPTSVFELKHFELKWWLYTVSVKQHWKIFIHRLLCLWVKKQCLGNLFIHNVFSDLRAELDRLASYLNMQIDFLFTKQVKIPAHLFHGEISGLLFWLVLLSCCSW